MADRIVGIHSEHRWHVALLKVPDTILRQNRLNLLSKIHWRLKIIEHGDRSDDLGGACLDRPIHGWGEKIRNQLNVARIELTKFPASRIDPDPANSLHQISLEHRSIVAADVDHHVAWVERHHPFKIADLLSEVVDHRMIEAGSITVILSVHFGSIVGMPKLEQSAIKAPH